MKYVVLDIDGTTLDSNHQLRENTKNYLVELQKRGIKVILASGRTQRRMQPVVDALQIDGYCISGNGYKVYHTKRDEEYIVDTFSDEKIQYFFNLLKPYEEEIFTFTDTILNYYLPERRLIEKQKFVIEHKMSPDTKLVGGPYGVIFNHGSAYDEINQKEVLNESAYKMCVRAPHEVLLKIQQQLKNEKCQCVITSQYWLEILPLKNSKGNALKLLCEKTGYDLNEMFAFGDGENDLSMLEIVKKGYAMANGQKSIQSKIKCIAPSNDEEGVYQILFGHFK